LKKYIVVLTVENCNELKRIVSNSNSDSMIVVNARILMGCDEGPFQKSRKTNSEISRTLNVSMRKIDRIKKRFIEGGIDTALYGRRNSRVYQKTVDDSFEEQLIQLSRSDPPEGLSKWSLRLLASRAAELGYIDSISHESVRRILRKNCPDESDAAGDQILWND